MSQAHQFFARLDFSEVGTGTNLVAEKWRRSLQLCLFHSAFSLRLDSVKTYP